MANTDQTIRADQGLVLLRRLSGYLVPAVVLLALAVLIIYPLGILGLASFLDSPPRPGAPIGNFTFSNYFALGRDGNLQGVTNSLIFSSLGSALALSIGSGLAWLYARTDIPGKALVSVAGIMPLFISALVGALAYVLLASPRTGFLNLVLRDLGISFRFNIYSGAGIIFVFGLYYASYAFLFVSSALQLMNPELEEAAEAHGASRFEVMRTITFPLVGPAVLGAGILTLILTLENFPVPQILGSPSGIDTMPSLVFRQMMHSPPRPTEAAANGVLLFLIMVGLIYLQSRILRERRFHTVTGKGFRPRLIPLGRWRWPALGLVVVYIFLSLVLPIFALGQSALRANAFIPDTAALFNFSAFRLTHFEATLQYAPFRLAVVNSLIVGVATAVVGTAFHFSLSYYVNRTTLPFRPLVEYIAMTPVAVPSLIIGMGFLWAWISFPIYGTLAILVLAYTARFTPQGYRAVSSTILQVHRDLEDSAVVSGATKKRAAWDILVPLIRPGLFSATMLLFVLSMRELSTSLFLFTANTRVLAIVLYEQWESGSWARVSTISLLYTALLFVIVFTGRRWMGVKTYE